MAEVYVPETDLGNGLSGMACQSSYMWLPTHLVKNKHALLNMAVFTTTNRSGDVETVNLAHDFGDYLALPRHLFADWHEIVDRYLVPEFEYEPLEYEDKIVLREGQVEAWQALAKADCGVLNLACGKGKTVLAIKKMAAEGVPTIVIVNELGLLNQWVARIEEHLGVNRDQIGLYQGKSRELDKPIVIASIQTLAKNYESITLEERQRFGLVIFDEVHHLSAPNFLATADLFYGKRFGLTATPEREDGLEVLYYAHLGQIFFSDLEADMPADIYTLSTEYRLPSDAPVRDKAGQFNFNLFYIWLAGHEKRNKLILKVCRYYLKRGRKIIALSHAKDHPNILLEAAKKDPFFDQFDLAAINGKTPGKDRGPTVRASDLTFASVNVAKENLDAKALDVVLFLTPFQAWGLFQQGKGRAERFMDGKPTPVAMLFEDTKIRPASALLNKLKRRIKSNGFTFRKWPKARLAIQ